MATTNVTRRQILTFTGVGLAAVVGINRYGVAQDATPGPGTPGASPEASPAASPAASPVASGSQVSVSMQDFKFVPREIPIAADTDVSIDLSNDGIAIHNFWITEVEQGSEMLDPGTSATLSVNLPAGEYRVICQVPGHVDLGMVAKLIVG